MNTYCFGEFELDLDAQELRAGGRTLHLERRPMDLLAMLVLADGKLVTREELIAALWPKNVIIDFESGLNTLVRKVRQVLEDSPDAPRFIATVSGRGYRFIAPIDMASGKIEVPVSSPPASARSLRARSLVLPVLGILLLLALALAVIRWEPGAPAPSQTRIAVLPFENLTGDDGFGYLASGLAEETGVSLSRMDLPNFSVIGGMSSRAIVAGNLPLKAIGEQLDADYLVVSSLRHEASRIRVTSRLVRVATDEQVWSASFDRELTNVLGLQREVSVAIAEQVRKKLSPEVAAAIDRRQTRNPDAYQLYLQGLHTWHQFAPDAVPRALEYYEAAVALDPRYALVWAEIARVHTSSLVTRGVKHAVAAPLALDALQKALEYGPELADVQLAAASYQMFIEWDYASAETAARRAVAMAPDNGIAHMVLGIVLSSRSKYVEANAVMRRARELEPFYPLVFAISAQVANDSGDPETGIGFARQAIAINPEFWPGYLHLANGLVALGRVDEAFAAIEALERYSGGRPQAVAFRAALLSKLGRLDEVREILAGLEALAETRRVSPTSFGVVFASLGEADEAMKWLEQAYRVRDIELTFADEDWRLESLHRDPRFQSLMERCQCGRQQIKDLADTAEEL